MLNEWGLTDEDMNTLRGIFSTYKTIEVVKLFGSRAKGNFKKGSDVDLAIIGTNLTPPVLANLSFKLNEETIMPYHFDVVDRNNLRSQQLAEHIDRAGKIIFQQKPTLT